MATLLLQADAAGGGQNPSLVQNDAATDDVAVLVELHLPRELVLLI